MELNLYSKEHPKDLPCPQTTAVQTATSGLRPHMDNIVWTDGLFCL